MSVQDVNDLVVLVTVLVSDQLKELLVFLHSSLLLLNAVVFLSEDVQLLLLALNFLLLLLILHLEFVNLLLTVLHCLHVGVQVTGVGDELF